MNTSKGKSDEVAKLKAELAAAEAKDKKDTASVHKVSMLVDKRVKRGGGETLGLLSHATMVCVPAYTRKMK